MIRRWKPGPHPDDGSPVYISVTDFELTRFRDLLRAAVTGLKLQQSWQGREGAIGVWLWSKPLQRRAGSISIWRSEEDLMRFVRWPVHVQIMRDYRDAGEVTSTSWTAAEFKPREVLREAGRRLNGRDPSLAHR